MSIEAGRLRRNPQPAVFLSGRKQGHQRFFILNINPSYDKIAVEVFQKFQIKDKDETQESKRKRKMKKHYLRMAIVIDLMLLVAFIIGLGFYTYVIANKEMDSCMKQVKQKASMHTPYLTDEDDAGSIIRKSYSEYWRNAAIFACAGAYFINAIQQDNEKLYPGVRRFRCPLFQTTGSLL